MHTKQRDGAFRLPDLETLPPDGGAEFNRLVFTSSPYLLQHARNPVDWHPWGEEAFAKARAEDKPVFLSIGYSTCHWCHVMEHESFENEDVAAFLNEHYVSIKVDREERPDVDHIYMTVCQAMTGSGGWPLSVFLTPEKKPFFAGMYFPPDDRFGRPGFIRVLQALHNAWTGDRQKVLGIGEELQEKLAESMQSRPGELPDDLLAQAVKSFKSNYDEVFGGFGSAPKFPMGHTLSFLLRRATAEGDAELLRMVEHTLMRMYRGGMWDHLGGGFCRYSVDRKWLVPHFEKMLYDNALLLMAYTDAFQTTGTEAYRRIAMEIVDYIRRDMTDATGLFFSAENADSEGVEGKFYVFTRKEFADIVGEHADMLAEYFGVEEAGNFEHGQNILHIAVDPQEWAQRQGLDLTDALERVADAKQKLFAARAQRIHPSLDDKSLASWNGLMIAALARAGSAFGDESVTRMAQRAADAILERMLTKDGTLLHRIRGGDAGIPGFLEDYAFLTWGLIDLYQATFDVRYLTHAVSLTEEMLSRFSAQDHGALFFTADDAEELIVRTVESHDGALPSGNSAAAYNLVRLARMTGRSEWEERAQDIMRAFAAQLERYAAGSTVMLTALDFAKEDGQEIVLAGRDTAAVSSLAAEVRRRWLPRSVLLFHPDGDAEEIRRLVPFIEHNAAVDGKPAAWVCRNFACEMPVHGAEELGARLSEI
ncbi:MAG: thioredoxin domain-containing protein [Bacteroidetes bacterium]|nr:thioredoxin domain-containing protein [Bacteroidota bacterium]